MNVLCALSGFTIVITSVWPYLQKVCVTHHFIGNCGLLILRYCVFVVQLQSWDDKQEVKRAMKTVGGLNFRFSRSATIISVINKPCLHISGHVLTLTQRININLKIESLFYIFIRLCYRLTKVQMPASWVGWWQPIASVRWWPHLFLACGLINDHAGSRWCAPSSSTCQPISTTPTYTFPELIISSTCSYPEPLWALAQVIFEMLA